MLGLLRRHPFGMEAHLKRVLALTYARPVAEIAPLLPRGLELDTFNGHGFVAVAMVEAGQMRPSGWPKFTGLNFFLAGYRLFVRLRTRDGRNLRGLYILRSSTDRRSMVWGGNALTRYGYRRCGIEMEEREERLRVNVVSPGGEADLRLAAALRPDADLSPTGSPPPGLFFPDEKTARRFAGPLPYTFSMDPDGKSAWVIEGERETWNPRLVSVKVECNSFRLSENTPRLDSVAPASAFYVADVAYRWKRGVRVLLPIEES